MLNIGQNGGWTHDATRLDTVRTIQAHAWDIFICIESKLGDQEPDTSDIPGYTAYIPEPRENDPPSGPRSSGGVMVLVKDSPALKVSAMARDPTHTHNVLRLTISIAKRRVDLVAAYLSGSAQGSRWRDDKTALEAILDRIKTEDDSRGPRPRSILAVFGDLNAHTASEGRHGALTDSEGSLSPDPRLDQRGRDICEMLEPSLAIINGSVPGNSAVTPTCVSSRGPSLPAAETVIDYAVGRKDQLARWTSLAVGETPTLVRDHRWIVTTLRVIVPSVRRTRNQLRTVWDVPSPMPGDGDSIWSRIQDAMRAEFDGFSDWQARHREPAPGASKAIRQSYVDAANNEITTRMKRAAMKGFGRKRIGRGPRHPWSRECTSSRAAYHKALKKRVSVDSRRMAAQGGDPSPEAMRAADEAISLARSEYRKSLRAAAEERRKKLVGDVQAAKRSAALFRILDGLASTGGKGPLAEVKDEHGELVSGPAAVARWERRFRTALPPEASESFDNAFRDRIETEVARVVREDDEHRVMDTTPTLPYCEQLPQIQGLPTWEEFVRGLRKQRTRQGSGPDDVVVAMYKHGGFRVQWALYTMFCSIWRLECVPSSWKDSTTIPIHKSGDRHDATNYRPIALMCVVAKLFEHILWIRLLRVEGSEPLAQELIRMRGGAVDDGEAAPEPWDWEAADAAAGADREDAIDRLEASTLIEAERHADTYRRVTEPAYARGPPKPVGGVTWPSRLHEAQNCRPLRNCDEHLFTLLQTILGRRYNRGRRYGDQGNATVATFLDISSAFDCVWRDGLWYSMLQHGFSGRVWRLVRAMYSGTRSRVRVGNVQSGWFEVPLGVRQGSVISPALFAMFIDELATDVEVTECGIPMSSIAGINPRSAPRDRAATGLTGEGLNAAARDQAWWDRRVSLCMFADDVVLLSCTPEGMQTMLDASARFARRWRLWFNTKKGKSETCVYVRQCPGPVAPPTPMTLGTRPLGFTAKYKYLGLLTEVHSLLAQHVEAKAKSYQNSVNFRVRARGHLHHACLPVGIRSMMARVFGATGVEYGLGVWGPLLSPTQLLKLENAHKHAARSVLRIGKLPLGEAVLGELGWTSVERRIQDLQLRFYARLKRMAPNRTPRLVYEARRFRLACSSPGQWKANEWQPRLDEAAEALDVDLSDPTARRQPILDPETGFLDEWAGAVKAGRAAAGHDDLQTAMASRGSVSAFGVFDRKCIHQHYLTGYTCPDTRSVETQARLRLGVMRLHAASHVGARPQPPVPGVPDCLSTCCTGCLRRRGRLRRQSELHVVLECPVHSEARTAFIQHARRMHVSQPTRMLGEMVFGSLTPATLVKVHEPQALPGRQTTQDFRSDILHFFALSKRLMKSIATTHETDEQWRSDNLAF